MLEIEHLVEAVFRDKDLGRKDDVNKPAVWQGVIQQFPRALWKVAEVSEFGAGKYSWSNWKKVDDAFNRYKNAQFRHALLDAMGEQEDGESKMSHLVHEAWNALATLELYLREQSSKDITHEGWPSSMKFVA